MAAETSPSPMSRMRAPGLAHLPDEPLVAGPVEDDHGQVLDVLAERVGHRAQVGGDRPGQVHGAARVRADRDLLHVGVGRAQQGPLGPHGDDADGVGRAGGAEPGALERVDGDLDLQRAGAGPARPAPRRRAWGPRPAPPPRSPPRRRRRGRRSAPRMASVAAWSARVAVPAPHEPGRGQRRGLGDANPFERQVAIHGPSSRPRRFPRRPSSARAKSSGSRRMRPAPSTQAWTVKPVASEVVAPLHARTRSAPRPAAPRRGWSPPRPGRRSGPAGGSSPRPRPPGG